MAHVHHHVARSPVIAQWHEHNLAQLAESNLVATVVSIVYVTAGASDSTSAGQQDGKSTSPAVAIATEAFTSSTTQTVYNAPSRQIRPELSTSSDTSSTTDSISSFSTSTPSTNFASSSASSSLLAPSTASAASSLIVAAPASTAGLLVNASSQTSGGLSGGAKAGLAISILIAVTLIAFLIFFYRRRNKHGASEEHRRLDDEKYEVREKRSSMASRVSVHQSTTSAPRLSLRPLTQMFMPTPDKPAIHSSDSSNPFGDHAAEKAENPVPAAIPAAIPAAVVPVSNASDRTLSNLSDRSGRSDGQAFPSVVAGSRRNSPPGPGPNNVHRVLLDFKPSMEDELELRAGSLVRMLHEYDDGWALCIRLDRSQQGVIPRTCISKLPVKPRSAPPPPSVRQAPTQGRMRASNQASGARALPQGVSRGPISESRAQSASNAPGQKQFETQSAKTEKQQDPAAFQQSAVPVENETEVHTSAAAPVRKPVPGQAL